MSEKTIYALGFFDGVHLGHQALLLVCRHLAQRKNCMPGVVTFTDHPDTLVTGQTPVLINTLDERKRMFLAHGISTMITLPFNEKLRNTPWQDFLEDLLQRGAAGFVCGEDFRFGYQGEGSAQKLAGFCREKGLPWSIVPAQTLDGIRVSSTYIRQLLEEGEMEQAVRFLGHAHLLSGKVVPGRGLGHTIGIPTANLALPQGVLLPKPGVYACEAIVDCRKYLAVTNIGNRPTVGGHHTTVESWLLDFDGDLYGKHLTLLFYAFLRPEQKFDSLEELKAQIEKDCAESRKVLENC